LRALDTNVLLRYIVEDDPAQARRASSIIEDAQKQGERLFLPLLVMCETEWVLDRRYRQTRRAIADGIDQLLDARVFQVEQAALLRACVSRYRTGKASLADYVIGAVAEKAGCDTTVTFDRDLEGCELFQVL
jgi:predicted nucleic-acid-binding protein